MSPDLHSEAELAALAREVDQQLIALRSAPTGLTQFKPWLMN